MPRFFIDISCRAGQETAVDGENGRHIVRSLRMRPGEALTLCDGRGTDYPCEIVRLEGETVYCKVLAVVACQTEPSLSVTLMQSLPKADKMELVIQKAVELGVAEVVPMLSARCVSRPDAAALKKKTERWQKIALEAAKQSGRGVIPRVKPAVDYRTAVKNAAGTGEILFFYEGGGENLLRLVKPGWKKVSIVIGPEGGFEDGEVEFAKAAGAKIATLGPRILRTETAPLAALAAVMLASGNM